MIGSVITKHFSRASRHYSKQRRNNGLTFDKKLAKEEIWLRQGIKARRTRNEGRVRGLEKMRALRRERRTLNGTVRMQAQEAERSGMKVIKVEDMEYGYDNTPVIRGFSTTIMRGDKVGIIGPNGAGKSTLLRLLLGELTPQQGMVQHGTHLQIAYFDQLREQLQDDKSVFYNVGDGNDFITLNGKQQHVIGYLQKFLFSPERAQTNVSVSFRWRTQSPSSCTVVYQAGKCYSDG